MPLLRQPSSLPPLHQLQLPPFVQTPLQQLPAQRFAALLRKLRRPLHCHRLKSSNGEDEAPTMAHLDCSLEAQLEGGGGGGREGFGVEDAGSDPCLAACFGGTFPLELLSRQTLPCQQEHPYRQVHVLPLGAVFSLELYCHPLRHSEPLDLASRSPPQEQDSRLAATYHLVLETRPRLFGGLFARLALTLFLLAGGLRPCPFSAERGLQVSDCLQGKSFTCFITPCLPVNDASCSCLKHNNLPLPF